MPNISNPPLEPPGRRSPHASHGHSTGPIVNPLLEGSRAGPAADAGHENPPLDAATPDPTSTAEVLDNPQLDTASVEAWFEAQLGSDTVPTTKPTPSRKSSTSKGSGSTRSTPKKKSSKKQEPRVEAAEATAPKRSTRRKQAARKRR